MRKQEIVERLRTIQANSMRPVEDYSESALRAHWKYKQRDDLYERDRLMYVAGYLAGRSIESGNLRESLRSLIQEVLG